MKDYEYEYKQRVGFSQCDMDSDLFITSLIDMFQDSSIFQSADVGVGFYELRDSKLVWMISYWEIEIDRMPRLFDVINVGTFPYAFKGFLGYRNFYISDENDEKIIRANSCWTLLDTEHNRPVKAPDFILDAYKMGEKLEMNYGSRKIQLPSGDGVTIEEHEPITIGRQHLDSNEHVNNCQYIKIALSEINEVFKVKSIRVDYRLQAHLNDVITPVLYREGNTVTIALNNEEGKPYSVTSVTFA